MRALDTIRAIFGSLCVVAVFFLMSMCIIYDDAESLPRETPQEVEISEPTLYVDPEPIKEEPAYTEEELEILAIIIYQEAGGNVYSDKTRQMVGEAFLNRVASERYPNTFIEVATQRNQYGRLYWTGVKWPDRASKPQEASAVKRAYYTAEMLLSGEVGRLLPDDVVYQAEFEQGKETVVHVPGFYFCR